MDKLSRDTKKSDWWPGGDLPKELDKSDLGLISLAGLGYSVLLVCVGFLLGVYWR